MPMNPTLSRLHSPSAELGLLVGVLVAVGVIERARRLREVGGLRDVQHPALRLAQLGHCDGSLARTG